VLRISCKWAYSQNIEKVIRYCYNRGNYKAFNDFIVNCNSLQGLQRFNDLEGLWNHIKNVVIEGTNKFIPLSGAWRYKIGWKRPVSKDTVRLIKKKHRLWKRFMETRDPSMKLKYNKCRNAVKNELRRREQQEQLAIVYESKTNPKRFLGYIKSKTKLVSGIGTLNILMKEGLKI